MMQALKGSLVALVTPMEESGEVDYESLEKLIDWHINHGTNGIVSVGTTGCLLYTSPSPRDPE